MTPHRVLVTGVPRSGTTWAGKVLGLAEGAVYVNEPDNETVEPYAIRAKRGLGRVPLVDGAAPARYAALWDGAFAGGARPEDLRGRTSRALYRRTRADAALPEPVRRLGLRAGAALAEPLRSRPAGAVVVKSVFVGLCLDWLLTGWAPSTVLVVKHPLNLLASWVRLGWGPPLQGHPALGPDPRQRLAALLPDGVPAPPSDRFGRLVWQLGALDVALRRQAAAHPGVQVVAHEDLCDDPLAGFRALADRLGLDWSPAMAEFLRAQDTEGSGTYDTARRAADERDAWRRRLDPADAGRARELLAPFGLPL